MCTGQSSFFPQNLLPTAGALPALESLSVKLLSVSSDPMPCKHPTRLPYPEVFRGAMLQLLCREPSHSACMLELAVNAGQHVLYFAIV